MGAKSHLAAGLEQVGVANRTLWAGLLGAPLVFAAAQLSDYVLVRWMCARDSRLLLFGITAAALLTVGGALAVSVGALRRMSNAVPLDRQDVPSLARFMALLSVLSCAFFMLALVALFVPQVAFHDCR